MNVQNGQAQTSNTAVFADIAGKWRWVVIYSGDGTNPPITLGCGAESFTIAN